MNNKSFNIEKNDALIAGGLYLVLIIVGIFGFAYVLPQIIKGGDIATTMSNIAESESLFRTSIFSILLVNIVSIILVLYLYKLLAPINKSMAIFMLSFLLLGAGISMLNEVNHAAALIINSSSSTVNFSIDQAQNLTRLFIDMHNYGTQIAAIFIGLWLFPLGTLIFKLGTKISKVIGIMLLIAGIGRVLDSIIFLLIPDFGALKLSDYTVLGELLLTIWLLIKSRDVELLVFKKVSQ